MYRILQISSISENNVSFASSNTRANNLINLITISEKYPKQDNFISIMSSDFVTHSGITCLIYLCHTQPLSFAFKPFLESFSSPISTQTMCVHFTITFCALVPSAINLNLQHKMLCNDAAHIIMCFEFVVLISHSN